MAPAPTFGRRQQLVLGLGLVVVVAVVTLAVVTLTRSPDEPGRRSTGGCRGLPSQPATASRGDDRRPFLGSLLTAPGTAAAQSRAGVKMAMLELSWRQFEPRQGQVSESYVRQACAQLARFRAAGMQVTLGLGTHYTPQWVLDRPHSRYVDQDGTSSDQADFVFNQDLRDLADDYLRRVDDALGLGNFWAVRVTSGGNSELFYPGGGDYWAFNAGPRPPSLARNPLPGWKPATGDTSPSPADRTAWERWYVTALADAADWQIGTLRALGFTGYVQLLTPGQGLRPSELADRIRDGLPAGLVGRGAVWSQVYGALRERDRVSAYVSSVADGSGDDDTCRSGDRDVALDSADVRSWSATRWISRIAAEHGMSVAGENSAYPTSDDARRHYADTSGDGLADIAYRQAHSCGFLGLYWAHGAQLDDDPALLRTVGGLAGDDPLPPADAGD